MTNRRKGLYLLSIMLILGAVAAIMSISNMQTVTAQSESLYDKLQKLAKGGDQYATAYLERLHAYLHDKRQPTSPIEEDVGFKDRMNGTTIVVKGRKPYYLKLYNEPELPDLAALETYAAARNQTLQQLVDADPNRVLKLSISFNRYTDLDMLWKFKETYGIDIDEMTIHLFVDNQWHSVMFVGDPREPDDQSYINFDTSLADFTTQLHTLISRPGNPAEGMPNDLPEPAKVVFKAEWMQAKIQAGTALEFSRMDAVLLVDPVSDFFDKYFDQAMDVVIVDLPNLHAKREVLQALHQSNSSSTTEHLQKKFYLPLALFK
ncbi:MAG: hypothetical protein DYG89_23805 [Caldilinea sp. CFX5]|nr:hypothetical protein [Caldilinea sp. CFX5]